LSVAAGALTVTGGVLTANNNTVLNGSSGTALTVQGVAGNWAASIASASSGVQDGLIVSAGVGSGDNSFLVQNRTGSQLYLYVRGDGYLQIGQSAQIQLGPGTSAATLGSGSSIISPTLSGTISGTPTWSSGQSFPAGSTHGGHEIVSSFNISNWIVDGGSSGSVSIPPGGGTIVVTFSNTFTAAPIVVGSISFFSGSLSVLHNFQLYVSSVSTTQAVFSVDNATAGNQSVIINWMAFGH